MKPPPTVPSLSTFINDEQRDETLRQHWTVKMRRR